MKFWLGLGIGVVLGGGGMYLATRHAGGAATVPQDPGVVAVATDAGAPSGKKKPRRHRVGGAGGGGTTISLDDGTDDSTPPPVLSDGDRRLVWQGDDVSLGARKLDMSSAEDSRPLEQGEINAGLSSGASSFEKCISSSVAGAELSAAITMQLQVDGKGQVAKVRVQAPQWLFAHGLYTCLRGAARRLSFAATGQPTVVTEPFTLD